MISTSFPVARTLAVIRVSVGCWEISSNFFFSVFERFNGSAAGKKSNVNTAIADKERGRWVDL